MYMRELRVRPGHAAADPHLVGPLRRVADVDGRPRRRHALARVGVAGREQRGRGGGEGEEDACDAAHVRDQNSRRGPRLRRLRRLCDALSRSVVVPDVTTTMTAHLPTRSSSAALDFEALYRAARDDVYAYVATLLRDRAAAEDVTAAAFERAYRKQRTFKAAPRIRAGLAVRHRPQRRARRAASPQARGRADRRAGRHRRRAARGRGGGGVAARRRARRARHARPTRA